jgi:hypothetical protein
MFTVIAGGALAPSDVAFPIAAAFDSKRRRELSEDDLHLWFQRNYLGMSRPQRLSPSESKRLDNSPMSKAS